MGFCRGSLGGPYNLSHLLDGNKTSGLCQSQINFGGVRCSTIIQQAVGCSSCMTHGKMACGVSMEYMKNSYLAFGVLSKLCKTIATRFQYKKVV